MIASGLPGAGRWPLPVLSASRDRIAAGGDGGV